MREICWTEDAEEHIARHNVSPGEVEEVVYTRPRWVTSGRDGTTLIYGRTDAGRYLLVVLGKAMAGGHYVVTTRELTEKERRIFRNKAR
ncbi:hypothetical protein [Crossiella sp. CA198]|uniref:hypothetical protein n=1 Tax=Crossiella sp. CA198 TaxID=3455607 RepID=UPI003F8D075D